MMPTLLHTESSNGWGGQEIRILEESLAFRKKGFEVMIAGASDGVLGKKAREQGILFYPTSFRFCSDPLGIWQVRKIIAQKKVDIVHTHSGKDSWTAGMAAFLSRTPLVRSRHLSTPVKKQWTSHIIYNILPRCVITTGCQIRNTLIDENGFEAAKIKSIPAGVDVLKFHPDVDSSSFIKEFNLHSFSPKIGVVAVLRSWKGHDDFISAVNLLKNSLPKARYFFIGDGPRKDHIIKKINEMNLNDKMILTGHRTDIPHIMKALDIVVLPSYAHEATSQVLPQAMCVGTPVIGTKVGGIEEIIEDKVTGLLVPPKNPEALADAILWITKHPEEASHMALKGREHILKKFTFTHQIEKTEKIYRIALNN